MDLRNRYKTEWHGFSFIEVIVILAIIVLMAGVSDVVYVGIRSRQTLNLATETVVESFRQAKANAERGNGNSEWGVKIFADKIVLFKGSSYTSRDTSSDREVLFTRGVTASGLSETVFERMTGLSLMTGTTTIRNDQFERTIHLNEKGTVTY